MLYILSSREKRSSHFGVLRRWCAESGGLSNVGVSNYLSRGFDLNYLKYPTWFCTAHIAKNYEYSSSLTHSTIQFLWFLGFRGPKMIQRIHEMVGYPLVKGKCTSHIVRNFLLFWYRNKNPLLAWQKNRQSNQTFYIKNNYQKTKYSISIFSPSPAFTLLVSPLSSARGSKVLVSLFPEPLLQTEI